MLYARNKIHAVKKESYVLKNKSMLVDDELQKTRKETKLLQSKLKLSRNKLCETNKDIEIFKKESDENRKERIKQNTVGLENRKENYLY